MCSNLLDNNYVTNIISFGLAMINWSIGLLNPGDNNSFVVLVCALDHVCLKLAMCYWGSTVLPMSAATHSIQCLLGNSQA